MTKAPTPTEMSKGQVPTQTTPQKSSIKQRLRTDLGRSVGVTKATQLVWLNSLDFFRVHIGLTHFLSRLFRSTLLNMSKQVCKKNGYRLAWSLDWTGNESVLVWNYVHLWNPIFYTFNPNLIWNRAFLYKLLIFLKKYCI